MSFFLPRPSSWLFFFCRSSELYQSKMDTRYCSACLLRLSPLFFLRDAFALPSSRVFATCYVCREKNRISKASKKRSALLEIDPNIGPPPTRQRATSRASPSLSILNYGPISPIRHPPPPIQCSPPLHPPISPVRSPQPPFIQFLPIQPSPIQSPPI